MSEGWIPPDPDWWKVPFDPEDWLPPPDYQDMFGPWGPGGPFYNPGDPFGPGTEPPAGWGPDGPWWEPPPEPPPGSSPFDIPPGEPPWGWGPDGPIYAPPQGGPPPAAPGTPPIEPPPIEPPPIEPPPIEPPPAGLVGGAAVETASVFALAALAPILLVAAGLYLPARAWGRPTWYWPWEDPCDDDFTELSIAFRELADDAEALAGKPSRRGASETLAQASYVIRLCQQFLRECPKNSHAATVRQMLAAGDQARDDCLDYLATH